jgi:hypothetical protein
MAFFNSKPHHKLTRAIDMLFMADFYEDTSRVGKDDYNRDYLIISNFSDLYIRDCVKKVMIEHCRYFASPYVEGEYVLKCLSEYDNNGIARYPRSSYIFNIEDEMYRKLWLFKEILDFYDVDEHNTVIDGHSSNEFCNREWDYQITETLTAKDYNGHNIQCTIANRINPIDNKIFQIQTIDKEPNVSKIEDYFMYLNVENRYGHKNL